MSRDVGAGEEGELLSLCRALLCGAYEEAHKHPVVCQLFCMEDGDSSLMLLLSRASTCVRWVV